MSSILRNIVAFLTILLSSFCLLVAVQYFTCLEIQFIPVPKLALCPGAPPPPPPDPATVELPSPVEPRIDTADLALAAIEQAGKVTVAASRESGPYSHSENNEPFTGFEVELVQELVRRWFNLESGDIPEEKNLLEFVGVNVIEREETIRNNYKIDFLIGGVSFTDDRCIGEGLICTSQAHFSDKRAILVQRNSVIKQYCDEALDRPETYITVLSHTAATINFENYKKECGFTNDIKPDTKPSRKAAFDDIRYSDNKFKIYKTERRFLQFYNQYYGYSDVLQVVVDEKGSKSETYVIWLRDRKKGLRDLIDRTLQEIREDGTFQQICLRHFEQSEPNCISKVPLNASNSTPSAN